MIRSFSMACSKVSGGVLAAGGAALGGASLGCAAEAFVLLRRERAGLEVSSELAMSFSSVEWLGQAFGGVSAPSGAALTLETISFGTAQKMEERFQAEVGLIGSSTYES
jgi:hypothetical protein